MSSCKKCGLAITWKKVSNRWLCYNSDGSDHWDRCNETRTRRAIEQGIPFTDKKGEGFKIDGRKMYTQTKGVFIPATDFSLPDCDCKSPPWEECKHTRQLTPMD